MESKIIKEFLSVAMPKIKSIYYVLAWGEKPEDFFSQTEHLSNERKEEIRNAINCDNKEAYQETGNERYNIFFKTFEEYKNYRNQVKKEMIDLIFSLGMGELDMDVLEADINEIYKDDITEIECNPDENHPYLSLKEELLLTYKKTIIGREKLKEALSQATVFDREKGEQEIRDQQKK